MCVDRELQLKLFSHVINDREIKKRYPDIEKRMEPLINETLDRSEKEEKEMIQKQKNFFKPSEK